MYASVECIYLCHVQWLNMKAGKAHPKGVCFGLPFLLTKHTLYGQNYRDTPFNL